jgi:hypothetical protein
MPGQLLCPHCRRAVRVAVDDSDDLLRCPTCGKKFYADEAEAMPVRSRSGNKIRDDYDPDEYDEYDDDLPRSKPGRRSKSGRGTVPGKAQAVAIMTLIGGIMATLISLGWLAYFGMMGLATLGLGLVCCLWPGPYYGLTAGILAIVKGAQLMGQNARSYPPPRGTAILLIINIINGDMAALVLGILILVFCGDPEVENYFQG